MSSPSPQRRSGGGTKPIPTFNQYTLGSRSYNDLATHLQTVYVQRGGVSLDVTEIESFLFEAGIPNVDTSLLMSFVLTVRRGILRGERDGGGGGGTNKEEPLVGKGVRSRLSMTSATSTKSSSAAAALLLDPIGTTTTTTITTTRPIIDAMEIMALVDEIGGGGQSSHLSSGNQNNSPTADLSLPAGGLKRRKSISHVKNGNDMQRGESAGAESGAALKVSSPTSAHLYMAMYIRETSSSILSIPTSSPVVAGGIASRERSASGIHRQSSRSGGRALPPLRQGGADGYVSAVAGRRLLPGGGGAFPSRLSPQDRLEAMKKIQTTFRCHIENHPSRTAAIPITARSTTVPLPMLIELGIICIVRGLKRATLASQADEAARVVWTACGMDESSLPAAAGKKLRSLSIVSQDSSTQSTSHHAARTQLPLSILREHIVTRFFTSPIPIIAHESTSEMGENSTNTPRRQTATENHRAGSTHTIAGDGGAPPNITMQLSSSTSTAPPAYDDESMMTASGQDPLHSGSGTGAGGDTPAALSTSIQWGDSSSGNMANQLLSSSSGGGVRRSKSLTSQCSADLPSFVHFVGQQQHGDLESTATFVAPQSPTFEAGCVVPRQPPSQMQSQHFAIGAHARRSLSYENSSGGGGSLSEPTLSFEDLRNLLAEAVDDSSLLIALVFNNNNRFGGNGGNHTKGGGRRGSGGANVSDGSLMEGPSGIDISRSENLIEKRQQLAKLLSVQHAGGGAEGGEGRPGSPQLGDGGGPLGHLSPPARHLAQQISSDLRNDLLSEDDDTQHKIALLLHGSLLHSSSSNNGRGVSGGLPTFSIPQRKQSSTPSSEAAQKWNKLFALAAGDGSTGQSLSPNKRVTNSAVEYQQIQECEMMHMDVLEGMLGVGPLSTPKRIRAVIRALAAFGRALERARDKRKRQGGGGGGINNAGAGGGNLHFTSSMYHHNTPTQMNNSPSAGGTSSVTPTFSNMPSPIKNHFRSVLQATLATGTFLHHSTQKQQDANGESMSMTLPLDGEDSPYSDLGRQLNYALQTHITPYLKLTQPASRSPQSPRGGMRSPRFSDDECVSADGTAPENNCRQRNNISQHHGLPSVHSPVRDRLAKLQAQLDAIRNDKNALLLAQDTSGAIAVGTEVAPFRASKTSAVSTRGKKKPFRRRMVEKGVQTDFDPTVPSMVGQQQA